VYITTRISQLTTLGAYIMMTNQKKLRSALKVAEPIIQEYIKDLIEENHQLKTKHAKSTKEKAKSKIMISELKIQNETYKRRISALQKALNKSKSEGGGIILHLNPSKPSLHQCEK
jgi:peptidoglycan hydrolase CwlO-like protein